MKRANNILIFLFLFFLPTQFGKHFFFNFSYLSGIRVDYLSLTIYLTDLLVLFLTLLNFQEIFLFLRQKKIVFVFLLLIINIIFSQNSIVSLYRIVKIAELFIVYIIFKKNKSSDKILIIPLSCAGILEFFLVTLQFLQKHSLQGIFYYLGERALSLNTPGIAKASINGIEILRPYATFSHPNSLAGFYLLVYFFILLNNKLKRYLVLKNIILFTSSLLIFFSFSKTAIITYVFLNLLFLLKNKMECKICLLSRLSIFLILLFIFLQFKGDPLTLSKRLYLVNNSISIIRKYPLFGVGLGNFIRVQNALFAQKYFDLLNQPVHNIFLLFLSETGIVTTVFLTAIFYKELRRLIQNNLFIFIVLFITGLFDHYWLTLQQNWLLLGVVLGSL